MTCELYSYLYNKLRWLTCFCDSFLFCFVFCLFVVFVEKNENALSFPRQHWQLWNFFFSSSSLLISFFVMIIIWFEVTSNQSKVYAIISLWSNYLDARSTAIIRIISYCDGFKIHTITNYMNRTSHRLT